MTRAALDLLPQVDLETMIRVKAGSKPLVLAEGVCLEPTLLLDAFLLLELFLLLRDGRIDDCLLRCSFLLLSDLGFLITSLALLPSPLAALFVSGFLGLKKGFLLFHHALPLIKAGSIGRTGIGVVEAAWGKAGRHAVARAEGASEEEGTAAERSAASAAGTTTKEVLKEVIFPLVLVLVTIIEVIVVVVVFVIMRMGMGGPGVVVLVALLGVGEHFECFAQALESYSSSLLVSMVAVGVVKTSKTSVGGCDVRDSCGPFETKLLVGVKGFLGCSSHLGRF